MSAADTKIVDFVKLVFKSVSEKPEAVSIELEEKDGVKVLNIEAEPSDYSRFIGKDGVVINAVRKLIFSIAADDKCRWIINIPESK